MATPKEKVQAFIDQVDDFKTNREERDKAARAEKKALKKAAAEWEPLQNNDNYLELLTEEQQAELKAAYKSAKQLTRDSNK